MFPPYKIIFLSIAWNQREMHFVGGKFNASGPGLPNYHFYCLIIMQFWQGGLDLMVFSDAFPPLPGRDSVRCELGEY